MSKRVFDLLLAIPSLFFLLPLLVIIGVLIRLTSSGPAIFRQCRVGRHGRHFDILKFRTMYENSEYAGPSVTSSGDSRITPLGRWLRRSKLDELPQLFNVIIGDMSLVGPRPEVPDYVAKYPEDVRRVILSVRPGITDNASIEFRNEGELLATTNEAERLYLETILPKKLAAYVEYAENQTLTTDIKILFRTLVAVLRN